jgi:hypothetical protein
MTEPRQRGSERHARDDTPDEPPAVCEFGDCDDPVEFCVHFRDPEDYVYYCREHKSYVGNFEGKRYARTA